MGLYQPRHPTASLDPGWIARRPYPAASPSGRLMGTQTPGHCSSLNPQVPAAPPRPCSKSGQLSVTVHLLEYLPRLCGSYHRCSQTLRVWAGVAYFFLASKDRRLGDFERPPTMIPHNARHPPRPGPIVAQLSCRLRLKSLTGKI